MHTMPDEIKRSIGVLHEPGAVFEIRIPNTGRTGTVAGYFNDPEIAAKAVASWDGKANVYTAMNPVNPALLARAANRLKSYTKTTTADTDITHRRWLLVDCDPKRPAGISSSVEEKEAARERALAVRAWLTERGWPLPVLADSGNGYHLLYRIDLPNDEVSRDLVKDCLNVLAAKFDDEQVTVDTSVFNAGRIVKLHGTMSAKGDSTEDRPHRRSGLLEVPEVVELVPTDQLVGLAELVPKPQTEARTTTRTGGRFDLQEFIARHGLQVHRTKPWGDGTLYEIETCPFNPEHIRKARIIEFANGALSFGCFHNGCQSNGWHALRDLKEPGWRDRKAESNKNNYTRREESPESKPADIPEAMTATDILNAEFPEPVWAVPGLIPSGLTILAGAPKLGKSWLALCLGLALAYGGRALGKIPVEQTEVLYLALEDTARRIQDRLESLFAEPTEKLHFYFTWRRGQEAMDDLDLWLWQHQAVKIVIIDTLQKVRAPAHGQQQIYSADYEAVGMIKRLADRHDIAAVVVHHTRKAKGDDELDLISGSYGISGAADTAVILKRARGEADGKIFITGRDVEEQTLALKMEQGTGWTLLGDARQYEQTKERLDILRVLEESGEPMTPKAIADQLGNKSNNVKRLLGKIEREGFIKKVGYGKYIHISNSGTSSNYGYGGNSGNSSVSPPERVTDDVQELPIEQDTGNSAPTPQTQQGQVFPDSDTQRVTRVTGITRDDNNSPIHQARAECLQEKVCKIFTLKCDLTPIWENDVLSGQCRERGRLAYKPSGGLPF